MLTESPPSVRSSFCLLSTFPAALGPYLSLVSHDCNMNDQSFWTVMRWGPDFGQVAPPNQGHARISGIFHGQTIIINVHRTIVA